MQLLLLETVAECHVRHKILSRPSGRAGLPERAFDYSPHRGKK